MDNSLKYQVIDEFLLGIIETDEYKKSNIYFFQYENIICTICQIFVL